jgi:glutamate synthase (NADPH/NADH) small chain
MSKQQMLQFVKTERDMPKKRAPDLRTSDFDEIYSEYAETKAAEQSARCSQCGVPYCQSHCPLHNNIPDWLRLTAQGRKRPTHSRKSAAEFARRTVFAKATV